MLLCMYFQTQVKIEYKELIEYAFNPSQSLLREGDNKKISFQAQH